MYDEPPHGLLRNESASSAPRQGRIGVLPVGGDDDGIDDRHATRMTIAVICPECTNYATITGEGSEYRNVTRMREPVFACSQCSWVPTDERSSPTEWRAYYAGRLGGALLWAVNEQHIETMVRYLETAPNRRKRVEFDWEYRHLMKRMPTDFTSGRVRNDVVSLLKKLLNTRPHHVR